MKRLWLKLRMPLAVFVFLLASMTFLRLFSGQEDTWIRGENGEWVKHGNPSAPMPAADYNPPLLWKIMPLMFIASFALTLIFTGFHKQHNRLMYDIATRDIKFLGYISYFLVLTGFLAFTGCAFEIIRATGGNYTLRAQDLALIQMVYYFSGVCIVCGVVFFVLKRNVNDHYQLEKGRRELLETLERKA